MSSPKSVIESARKQAAKLVDVKFADTFGTWQHFSVPVSELTGNVLTDGPDGSSIRKWKSIGASDLSVPVLSTPCSTAETGTGKLATATCAAASVLRAVFKHIFRTIPAA